MKLTLNNNSSLLSNFLIKHFFLSIAFSPVFQARGFIYRRDIFIETEIEEALRGTLSRIYDNKEGVRDYIATPRKYC